MTTRRKFQTKAELNKVGWFIATRPGHLHGNLFAAVTSEERVSEWAIFRHGYTISGPTFRAEGWTQKNRNSGKHWGSGFDIVGEDAFVEHCVAWAETVAPQHCHPIVSDWAERLPPSRREKVAALIRQAQEAKTQELQEAHR